MKNKINRFGLILIIMFSLLSISGLCDWNNIGYDKSRSYFNYNESGDFGEYESLFTASRSSQYSPLIFDYDNDDDTDIIVADKSTLSLNIYNSNLDIIEEYILYGTISAGMDSTNYDDDNYSEINLLINTTTSIYDFVSLEYNSTDIHNLCQNQTNKTPRSAVSCYDDTCYYSTTSGDIVEIYLDNCTYEIISVSSDDIFNIINGDRYAIAFTDLNKDGDIDAIIPSNSSTGIPFFQPYSRVAVYDTEDDTLLSTFGTGGLSPTIDLNFAGLSISNLDDIGSDEIIITSSPNGASFGGNSKIIAIYNSVGTQIYSKTMNDLGIYDATKGGHISNPVTASPDYVNSRGSISFVRYDTSVSIIYNDTGYQHVLNLLSPDRSYIANNFISSAQIDDAVSLCNIPYTNVSYLCVIIPEIVSGGKMFIPADNDTNDIVDLPVAYYDYSTIVSDIDDDGIPDIIGYKNGGIYVSISSTINYPPTINNSLSYGGYGSVPSYLSPICVNSTITFQAGDVEDRIDGNYYNDYIEQERLVTDCGTDTDTTSDYSYNSPQVSCTYNETGTYSVIIYIEDMSNEGDISAYNSQTINLRVIDGIDGVTCSLGSVDIGDTGQVAGGSGDTDMSGFDDTINTFAGSSLSFRLIFAIAIIIFVSGGITSALSKKGVRGNALVLIAVMSAILTTIGLTALGIIPVFILILIIIISIFVMVFKHFIIGGSGT